MIISVDTGNKQMKTENCEFNSGVEILDHYKKMQIYKSLPEARKLPEKSFMDLSCWSR